MQALIVAHERRNLYSNISDNSKGVVFFGVPHSGSNVAMWGNYAIRVVEKASLGFAGNANFIKALEAHSTEFAHISTQFVERGAYLRINTFYELNQ